jgi:hypothetical protein
LGFQIFHVPFTTQLHFGRIFMGFTEFLKIRRIRHLPNFKEPPNFETLELANIAIDGTASCMISLGVRTTSVDSRAGVEKK